MRYGKEGEKGEREFTLEHIKSEHGQEVTMRNKIDQNVSTDLI